MNPNDQPRRAEEPGQDEAFALSDESGDVYDFTPPPRTLAEWAREQPPSTINRPIEAPAPSSALSMMLVAGVLALGAITALAVWLEG